VIGDARDPRLDEYRDLRDPDLRRARGLFAVEGRLLVERLLTRSRFRVRSVLVTPVAADALRGVLDRTRVPVLLASHAVMREVVGFPFHRGVIALGERGDEPRADTLLREPGPRVVTVLEDVRDPENVGAVFRSAGALGAAGVLLSRGSADPLNRKAIRVSAGAALTLPFARVDDLGSALDAVHATGYTIMALVTDGDVDVADVTCPPGARVVLLFGSESDGLSARARAAAHLRIRIPVARGIDSLNVAVAAGIALHHVARQHAR
jgi:tRNA G18 (ribose-2'-O)-methylase SpoU